ncbi:MAG: hypothetical protein LBV74_04435 [Tannerella sp.]|jgi:hypothetical protein|nr:hypothetical protein [Tannerella sp.]
MNLIFCLFIALFSLNGMENSISKLYLYDANSRDMMKSNTGRVEVDSSDLSKMIIILERSTPKKNPVYKPAANSLYGKVEIGGKLVNIRISSGIIYINEGEKRHYFIKDKGDLKWMKSFMEKYCLILKD